jgi:hypothetical protein
LPPTAEEAPTDADARSEGSQQSTQVGRWQPEQMRQLESMMERLARMQSMMTKMTEMLLPQARMMAPPPPATLPTSAGTVVAPEVPGSIVEGESAAADVALMPGVAAVAPPPAEEEPGMPRPPVIGAAVAAASRPRSPSTTSPSSLEA